MSLILNLSIDANTMSHVVEYYSDELDRDLDWDEAKTHLREDLYHEINKIADQADQTDAS
jgi:hypothetical protein